MAFTLWIQEKITDGIRHIFAEVKYIAKMLPSLGRKILSQLDPSTKEIASFSHALNDLNSSTTVANLIQIIILSQCYYRSYH